MSNKQSELIMSWAPDALKGLADAYIALGTLIHEQLRGGAPATVYHGKVYAVPPWQHSQIPGNPIEVDRWAKLQNGQAVILTPEQETWYAAVMATVQAVAPAVTAPPAPAAAPMPPAPPGAPSFPAVPPAPSVPAAPAAPAAPTASADAGVGADGKPRRVRRTKAQIEADEAALKAGYENAADMAARTGGTPAVQSAPVAPGATPVSQMPAVQQPSVPAAPPAPPVTDKGLEDITQAFQHMMQVVEGAGWTGHGEGQAGTLLSKLGFQNVHTIPPEARNNVKQWINYFVTEFQGGRLPLGAATEGFIK